jgi:hypothetical protein
MAKKRDIISINLKITGILLYQSFFNKQTYKDGKFINDENGKFSGTFLIPKNSPSGKKLIGTLAELDEKIEELFNVEIPIGGTLKAKHAILDGDDSNQFNEYNNLYKDNWVLSVKSSLKTKILTIFDDSGELITKDDIDKIKEYCYSGAIWTINITLYAIKKNLGVYALLKGGKFTMHGEKLIEEDIDPDELDADEEDILYFDDSF